LRRELLEHIIPFSEAHLSRLLGEDVRDYYNSYRTHQSVNRQTPILSEKSAKISSMDVSLTANPILGGLYHNYRKSA
jgi:hypothetical protein